METVTKEQVLEELECVIDPELGVDIVNLGLVYDVTFEEPQYVKVTMTMTSMGCPMAGHIIAEVKETLILHAGAEFKRSGRGHRLDAGMVKGSHVTIGKVGSWPSCLIERRVRGHVFLQNINTLL